MANPANTYSAVNAPTAVGPAIVFGNNIVLSAGENSLGGIGAAGSTSTFFIQSSYSATGTVTLAGNQNIYLTQLTGDIYLDSVSDSNAVALITAVLGSIWNGRDDNDPIVVAGQAELVAFGSIGASGCATAALSRIASSAR